MGCYARIVGWGKAVPERVLSNADLEKTLDTTDAWIRQRTGIRERRIAGEGETAATLASAAAHQALARSGFGADQLDLVIVATVTPETIFPACSSLVQHALGASRAGAFDVSAGCAGFIHALVTASQFIASGAYQRVLVVGSEVMSRVLDWTDRSTCVLFGDGAGALVLEASAEPAGLLGFQLGNDGSGAALLYLPGLCPSPRDAHLNSHHFIKMKGREVFRFAVQTMVQTSRETVQRTGLSLKDIRLFVPHQANERIIRAAARALELTPEQVFMNVDRYGNTSAASIPLALCEAAEAGLLEEGDHALLMGFGSGLSWGAAVLLWSSSGNRNRAPEGAAPPA